MWHTDGFHLHAQACAGSGWCACARQEAALRCSPLQPCQGPVQWIGVGRCAGAALGCGARSGFSVCLHTVVSAGLTAAETSDLFALVVIVADRQWVVGFLTLMNRSMLALGFSVLWIHEPLILLPLYNNGYMKVEGNQAASHFPLIFLGSSWSWFYLFAPGKGLLFASSSSQALGCAGFRVQLCEGGPC